LVGIAPTKTLAKVANRTAKKQPGRGGVCNLMLASEQTAALAAMALTDLWGVASRTAARLAKLGIDSPLKLRDADLAVVRQHLGVVGERMVLELRGVPCHGFALAAPPNKSIVASRSFGWAATERPELEQAVAAYTERAAEKLRRQGLAASVLTVFVTTNPFKPQERQYAASQAVTLPVASSDNTVLLRAAQVGLRRLWRAGYRYKKAGVMLIDLVPAATVQGDLWSAADTPARRRLMTAMDAVNAKNGRGTLHFAASGVQRGWALRSEQRSARFTTEWGELLKVG
jgi:DNA polymerase V